MKFNRYQEDNLIPAWRKAYFNHTECRNRLDSISTHRTRKTHSLRGAQEIDCPDEDMVETTPVARESLSGSRTSSLDDVYDSLGGDGGDKASKITQPSLNELYEGLSGEEREFFAFLEEELVKVEKFYAEREAEVIKRGQDLQLQLAELTRHSRIYHQRYPGSIPRMARKLQRVIPCIGPRRAHIVIADLSSVPVAMHRLPQRVHMSDPRSPEPDVEKPLAANQYASNKQQLRMGIMDFYRQLETIKRFSNSNASSFRDSLQAFERTTSTRCLDVFQDEKMKRYTFVKSTKIDDTLSLVEDMFTSRFEHGHRRKAREKLQEQSEVQTFHRSTMWSGMMIGVGLPLAIISTVQAIKVEAQPGNLAFAGLFQIYGAFLIPVILSMLFSINLAAFVRTRINYEFLMELKRPVLDNRAYLEIPSFLFLSLSFCMYMSFFFVGAEHVAPTTWPAAWLVFVVVFFLNPLPIFRRPSRWWFLRTLGRIVTPGIHRVDFASFLIADEINSLAFPFAQILFLSCASVNGWGISIFAQCQPGARWDYILFLSAPSAIRLIQSIKRYFESGLYVHLVNAGKYGFMILQYGMYIWWRILQSPTRGPVFIVWVIVATISASYASAFDITVDWALMKPGHAGLRKHRAYPHKGIYYFAIVTNVIIRFVFVFYIPNDASDRRLRSWIFALLEMIRRWQWNFFRVETEHLGNADAYRPTRDIPLPYAKLDPDGPVDD